MADMFAPFTLASVVRDFARTTPDAPGLTFEGTTYTFADLHERSSRVANALLGVGVGVGDRVAVLSKNSPEFFDIAFACSKIGALFVGLNWRLAPPEIAAIVADARPSLIVVGAGEQRLLDDQSRSARVIAIGDEFDEWRDAGSSVDPEATVDTDDVTMLLYTSGTTGVPKGVMITHTGLSSWKPLGAEFWGMSAKSVNLVAMPMFHIGGIGYALSTMSNGGHTVMMREFDSAAVVSTIAAHKVTHSFFVPAALQAILETEVVEEADLSSLELLVYGASPITDAVLRQAILVFGCGFAGAYGMTETSATVVVLMPEDHDPDGASSALLRSCGRVLPWVERRIIDPDTLDDSPIGAVGELWLRSKVVAAGYWNKPEATAEAIVAHGWLRTGDAAYVDQDGYIFLFDRFKDMIVSGGENIYPAEVENVLGDHPDVVEVAVIGVPDDRWGETVKAIVVRRIGSEATAGDLIEFARTRLARYKCPTSVDLTDVLPRNASGKLLKHELRQRFWTGHERPIN